MKNEVQAILGSAASSETLQWREEATMPKGVARHGSAIINDKLYIVGGGSGEAVVTDVQIYDLKLKTWSKGTDLSTGIHTVRLAAVGQKLYTFQSASDGLTALIYDTVTDKWTTGAKASFSRNDFAVVAVGKKIYVLGGFSGANCSNKLDIYDTVSDTWSSGANLQVAKAMFAAVNINNTIYAIYGQSPDNTGPFTNTIEVYNVEKNTWGQSITSDISMRVVSPIVIENKIITVGGQATGFPYLCDEVIIYDVVTEQWSRMLNLPMGMFHHTAHVYKDMIYVVGGAYRGDGGTIFNDIIYKLSSEDIEYNLSVLLEEEETARLIVTNRLADNTDYNWTSSDDSIARADANGYVTGVSQGECFVTAESKDGFYTDRIPVKVVPQGKSERLAVFLTPGQSKNLYLNEDYDNIQWASMDPDIVTVDGMGTVAGVGKGLAIVQAEYNGELYYIYVRVG